MGAFTMRQGTTVLTLCLAVVVVLLGLVAPDVSQATLTGLCGPLTSEEAQLGFCQKALTISGSWMMILLSNPSPDGNGGFIGADAFDLSDDVGATLVRESTPDFG